MHVVDQRSARDGTSCGREFGRNFLTRRGGGGIGEIARFPSVAFDQPSSGTSRWRSWMLVRSRSEMCRPYGAPLFLTLRPSADALGSIISRLRRGEFCSEEPCFYGPCFEVCVSDQQVIIVWMQVEHTQSEENDCKKTVSGPMRQRTFC